MKKKLIRINFLIWKKNC